ncbi:MAG: ABC transporter permease [Planctomycetota bacterium]
MATLQEIWKGVRRNRVRSVLIFTTFAVGFASVLVTIGSVEGGRRSIRSDLEKLGLDMIVCLNPVRLGPLGAGEDRRGKRIDQSTVALLRERLGEQALAVIPFKMELASFAQLMRAPTLLVTTPDFAGVFRDGILAGRFLNDDDVFTPKSSPVVLDEALARKLSDDPTAMVGKTFRAKRGGKSFEAHVVGVMRDPISLRKQLETFDSAASARSISSRRLEFKNIYVPMDEVEERPSGVIVRAPSVPAVDDLAPVMRDVLAEQEIEPWLHVQKDWAGWLIDMVDRFTWIAHFFWVVNLLVVLILNSTITTLAVEERYPEIAIRRVEGASVARVVWPLVGEGMFLALCSLPVGWALSELLFVTLVTPTLLWDPLISPFALCGTGLLLVLVGAGTTLLPVRRVAKLSPAGVLAGH